jgi:hypothetical protein
VPAPVRDAQRIGEHDLHERARGRRRRDRGRQERGDGQGQRADVVGMGMCDDDGLDAADLLETCQVGQQVARGRAEADAGIDQDAATGGGEDETAGADVGTA